MTRIEWLAWTIRWGNPRARYRNLRNFLLFELYRFGCLLCGYRIEHWLDRMSSPAPKHRPAGRYLIIGRSVPIGVRLLDRLYRPGKLTHADLVPYSPEAVSKVRAAGEKVEVVEIYYRLGVSE